MVAIPTDARALFEHPYLGHVVTRNADGSPQVSCLYVGIEDDDIVFGTQRTTRKFINIARDPRVVITVAGLPDPGCIQPYVTVRGLAFADDIEPEEWLRCMDKLSILYTGEQYPYRYLAPKEAWVRVHVEHVAGFGKYVSPESEWTERRHGWKTSQQL